MSSIKPIKVLSPELANQIAAGEVVERPASVVKELLENSLDASASEILIEIEQGGCKKILIRDNGSGISKSQLELALSRHATSKIESINDLERITSMGFRGEALASISSVSRLTLTSKPKNQSEAWQAHAEGQQMNIVVKPAAHPDGTTIEVLDLFFNTPARRKFLKTAKTEFQHIETLVKRLALTNPHVKFSLFHNNKRCFNFLRVDHIEKRIEQVCGKSFLQDCTEVKYQYQSIMLKGYATKLGKGLATRDQQFTFVNNRIMKDKLIAHALRQAYEDTLPAQTFPAYVLYLTLPPCDLDINVHPAKHEVRFHEARQIHDLVYKAITQSIGMASYVDEQPQHNYIAPLECQSKRTEENKTNKVSDSISSEKSSVSQANNQKTFYTTKPSQKELKATTNFYETISGANISDRTLDDAVKNANIKIDDNKADSLQQKLNENQHTQVTEGKYIFCSPFLIFESTGQKKASSAEILHVSALATLVVQTQITTSSASQPLLMPVSRQIQEGDEINIQSNNELLEKYKFEIISNHGKVIIKRVPSATRQLPWANIVGKLTLAYKETSVNDDSNQFLQKLSRDIAESWVETIATNQMQVKQWLSYVDANQLSNLKNKAAIDLDLFKIWHDSRGANEI